MVVVGTERSIGDVSGRRTLVAQVSSGFPHHAESAITIARSIVFKL